MQKQQKVRDARAHHRRGYAVPLACPAPPTHPAPCPCSAASRAAAFRARDPPQVGAAAPDWRDTSRHTKACPRMRIRRRRPLPALAAAPRGSRRWTGARLLSVGSLRWIDSKSKLRPILLQNEGAAEGQQGIARQGGACEHAQRSGMVAAQWAEAAHLIRHHRASMWKILSAERRRAGPDGAGGCFTARARFRTTRLSSRRHCHTWWPCRRHVRPAVPSRARAVEQPRTEAAFSRR